MTSALSAGLTVLQDPVVMPLNATLDDYKALAAQMKALNPDIVVAGSRVGSCALFLAGLKSVDWLPRALFTNLCANDPTLPTALAGAGLTLDGAF